MTGKMGFKWLMMVMLDDMGLMKGDDMLDEVNYVG